LISEPKNRVEGRTISLGYVGIVIVWFILALSVGMLWALNKSFWPGTLGLNAPMWAGIGAGGTLLVVLLIKPRILSLSTCRTSCLGAILAVLSGYAIANVSLLVIGKSYSEQIPGLGYRYLFLWALSPLCEESIGRGSFLASLLERLHPAAAIAISATLMALLHDGFWNAFFGEVLFGWLYVANKRSLAISSIAHSSANFFFAFRTLMLSSLLLHH
jgi:membrane protease YdiL (CAAX protease family)